ncbi:hypothetical protein [Streptosporangium lutulentum]|uniref:Uncharacterized protein n=1 Tax=Streptosporangium lutulentum TaxID=1461250 RepID=A0ABT9QNH7_9ACTN|nr:hypothetical protein [Streptosporangium lutulentum]MDP9848327.1 hypothetical protein [Streptosporangium lutulentum]
MQENHDFGDRKLCDFLLWLNKEDAFLGCAIELKGGKSNISHVAEQLQNGAQIMDRLTGDINLSFHPILVHAGIKTIEVRELDRKKIRYRGKDHRIELIRCGMELLSCKSLASFR